MEGAIHGLALQYNASLFREYGFGCFGGSLTASFGLTSKSSLGTQLPAVFRNHGVRGKILSGSLILKDLWTKSLRTNDLADVLSCQRASQNGVAAAAMAVLRDGATSGWPRSDPIIEHGGLAVCDGAHRWFVMKKVRDCGRSRYPPIRRERE